MKLFYLSLLLLASTLSLGQTPQADSLKGLLKQTHADTTRVLLLVQLAGSYRFYNSDSSLLLAQQAIDESQKLNFPKGEIQALNVKGEELRFLGELPQALEAHFLALGLSQNIRDREGQATSLTFIGLVYVEMREHRQALRNLKQANNIFERLHNKIMESFTLSNIGNAYERMNSLDSALFFQQQAYALSNALPSGPGQLKSLVLTRLGIVQARLGNHPQALDYYTQALRITYLTHDLLNRCAAQYRIAALYDQLKQPDSSLHYARMAIVSAQRVTQKTQLLNVSTLLVKLYQVNGNLDSAFHYQQVVMAAKDSLFGPEKFQRLQSLTLTEQQRQQQLLQEQARSQERLQRIGLLSALGVFLLVALLLWRNNRLQQRANHTLNQKNSEIEIQRKTLETTLADLRTTQTQLIQKEKMASLYEQQIKIHQVRNKIASELHDDIGSTLSSIYLFSEVAKKEINQDSLQALPMLDKIESSSQEMMQAMSEIVWSIHPRNDNTAHLVEKIHSFANELLSARNIVFRFEYPAHFLSLPMAMEVRRNIYLIFKETLNNIAKHSQATQVEMTVALEEKTITIGIRDNGRGFTNQSTVHGNGLRNLYSRAEEIGGRLHIDSRLEQGTGVYLQCSLA